MPDFIIDKIFVVFRDRVFLKAVVVPMCSYFNMSLRWTLYKGRHNRENRRN